MAPHNEKCGDPAVEKSDFDGCDLLVGRPEEAERGSPTATGNTAPTPPTPTPPPATTPQPVDDGTRDDAIQEILETVRTTAARIEALEAAQDPKQETAETLARETAALTQAVTGARGALVKAAELAGTGRRRQRAPWPGPPPR